MFCSSQAGQSFGCNQRSTVPFPAFVQMIAQLTHSAGPILLRTVVLGVKVTSRATGQTCKICLRKTFRTTDDYRSGGPLRIRKRGVYEVDPIQTRDAVFWEDREMRFFGLMGSCPGNCHGCCQVGQLSLSSRARTSRRFSSRLLITTMPIEMTASELPKRSRN